MRQQQDTFNQAYDALQAVQAELMLTVEMPTEDLIAGMGSLAIGHLLVESEPGIGKTLFSNALAVSMGGVFKRVQGSADVLPSDFTGHSIYNPDTHGFDFRPGPVFANVLLADEFNRNSAKTQAAVLEAMQENQVTVDGEKHDLLTPFIVVATQNPNEHGQGVNRLTKANLDRFPIYLPLRIHTKQNMLAVDALDEAGHQASQVIDLGDIAAIRQATKTVAVSSEQKAAIADLVVATRAHPEIDAEGTVLGGSRAFLSIKNVARYVALSDKRRVVSNEDIKFAAPYVLGHRIEVNHEALSDGMTAQDLVAEAISSVHFPVKAAA